MGNSIPQCAECKDTSCDAGLKDCIQELPIGRQEAPTVDQMLLSAARDGDVGVVESCLADGADVTARQPLKLITLDRYQQGQPVRNCGMTALMLACRFGRPKVVAILLKAGSRVNDFDEDGVTALHLACASGDLQCVQYLLAAGARTEVVNEDGEGVMDYLPQEVKADPELFKKFKDAIPQKILDEADMDVPSESNSKTRKK
eukprot:TRINITY_DN95492_c0_g1_i1.p1 TRINITY_DN95492_c0_g1~~TRINITY_DN95492_c0_g1_i1.p1  ORF type:complete len:202 (-),score=39.89 TRINITY_DN95492_c0_g1_i1:182-787(-)